MPPMQLPATSQRGRLAIAYIIWKVVSAGDVRGGRLLTHIRHRLCIAAFETNPHYAEGRSNPPGYRETHERIDAAACKRAPERARPEMSWHGCAVLGPSGFMDWNGLHPLGHNP